MSIEVWISIGSTYSYLTVMRLPALAIAADVELEWRPFDIRAILSKARYTPFADKPAKLRYMWRDIERRSAETGVPWSGPPPYPIRELELSNRLALVAKDKGILVPYLQACYRAWMLDAEPPGENANLARCAREIGHDLGPMLDKARSTEYAERLSAATAEAEAAGVFGSPTLSVGGELFWGDDRVEAALRWVDDHRHPLSRWRSTQADEA